MDEGGEEQANVNGLLTTYVQGHFQAWTIGKSQSWSKALKQMRGHEMMSVAPITTEGCAGGVGCPRLVSEGQAALGVIPT